MTEQERAALVDHLAHNPLAGDLVPGSGGLRKLRWALAGRGKRGGSRVIYYMAGRALPLFLLTAFAKNDRADLTQAERNEFRQLTAQLADSLTRRRRP